MHCQQQLVALLYAILGPCANTTKSLASVPDKSFGNPGCGFERWNRTLVNLSEIMLSKTNPDGQGHAVSLNCPIYWDDPGMLDHDTSNPTRTSAAQSFTNVTLTMTIPEDQKAVLQRCESLFEAARSGDKETILRRLPPWENASAPLIMLGKIPPQAQAQESYMEHSDPQRKRRNHNGDGKPKPSSDPDSDSTTQKYKDIVDHLMSIIQRKKRKLDNTVDDTGSYGTVRPGEPTDPIRRNSNSRHSRCMDTFCGGFDLKKSCTSRGKSTKKEICELCYPKRNQAVIEQHCTKQEIRERQAFFGVCVLLGCSIVTAALLYVLRSFCRRVQRRYRLFRGLCSSQSSRSPATKSRSSSILRGDSMPGHFPGLSFNAKLEIWQRGNDGGTNDVNGLTTSRSMLQRKWHQFGMYRRESRKRIQDVFDIESLNAKPAENRIPVLPRAPNASIRRHLEKMDSRRSGSFNDKGLEGSNGSVVFK